MLLNTRTSLPIAGLLATLLVASPASAQDTAGLTIHFSGYLTDLSNNPVNGFVNVQVRILDQPMAGNELFFEQHQQVEVNDGALELDIGSVADLGPEVFKVEDGKLTGGGRYIGLTLDSDRQEMSPRFPIPVVPFAVRSLLGGGGPAGPAGADGVDGAQGPAGAMGPAGADGAPGVDGAPGADGVSVTASALLAADPRCAQGGVEIVGANGTVVICHGAAGSDGLNGLSVTTAALPQGDTDCPAGGVRVTDSTGDRFVCNGIDGLNGADGAVGPQGPIGLTGPAGANGVDGAVGPQGPIGLTGPAGATGATGAVGPQGPIGLTGPAGATGPQGPIGLTGPAGATGATGAAGTNGVDGATGAQGPIGLTGPAGATGAVGPQGPIGLTGSTGATGAQGPIGLTGPAGATGATGPAGPTGATGPAGPTGATGPAGPGGGGVVLVDNNSAEIGKVLYADGYGATVLTTTGHTVSLNWDGTISPGQIYYTGAGCTGTAYLNSGWSGAGPLYGSQVVYSGSFGSLMVPTNLDANGLTPNASFTSSSIDNPTCGSSSGTRNGYLLVSTSAAGVGLPSYPAVAPLTMQ